MDFVEDFKDLDAYKASRKLSRRVFEITKEFPKEEVYSLTSQIRRSTRSISAQIAEAWGKRKYEKHFVSKLTDADGEQLETQHWIATANDCKYISEVTLRELLDDCNSINKMLNGMIKRAPLFCQKFK